ncbi:hypothetical protein KR009_000315, partial [Drosophila setifemur]
QNNTESYGSAMDPDLYHGNAIFRNQPSYKAFNKSFENANDSLYTFLNEVDPEVLRQEEKETSEIFTSFSINSALKDPRTNEVPAITTCDHTYQRLGYTFPLEQYSALNLNEHAACLRVLLSWQRSEPVAEEDFVVWHATEKKRSNECQVVQKHFHDQEQAKREVTYAPMKRLVKAYRKWFDLRMNRILKDYPNEAYVTFSGLPQLSQCKSLNSQTASIEQVELERIEGQVRVWPEVELKKESLRTLNVRLDRYSSTETKDLANLLRNKEKNLKLEGGNIIILPLDSLMMLLTTGLYIDLCTEMFLKIKESSSSGHKCLEFQSPFPARNCGWHTNSFVLKQAFEAYISQPGQAEWLEFEANGSIKEVPKKPWSDNSSVELQMNYEPHRIEPESSGISDSNSNSALVTWTLKSQNQDMQIYTTLSIPAVRDSIGKQPLGCHFIKLENKPDCGCEIMSKYELLKAWLQMKLLQAEFGHCTRVSLRDFEPLLEEKLTLASLEKQLHDYYNTSMPQLMSNLCEFLKLLDTVPVGDYLLRYSPKYKDKFLLCNATMEASAQSFQLHQLLKGSIPSDQSFLTQSSYLPISPTLFGRLHEDLQLLPCAFPAKPIGKVAQRRKPARPMTDPTVQVPDRQPLKKKAVVSDNRRKSKAQQKARAKARKKAAAKEEEVQLEKIMCL